MQEKVTREWNGRYSHSLKPMTGSGKKKQTTDNLKFNIKLG